MTQTLGKQIEMLVAGKVSGQPPDAQLCQWLETIPESLRQRLVQVGLLDFNRAAAGKKLTEHLDDYRQFIGDNTKHSRNTYSALVKLFADCKFIQWADIQASRLYNHLMRLKSKGVISERTFNYRLKAARSFCAWMVQDRRASESPIGHLKPLTITERRIQRRALEDNELSRFLDATVNGPTRFGMDGHERYLLYRFAIETGLRSREIRNLTVDDFEFAHRTVTVNAGSSKRKHKDVQAMKPETAKLLQTFFKTKMPFAKAFGGTYRRLTDRTADMVKADLAAADVDYIDDAGRVFDFHSLRHQTGSMLARYGVHPRDAQAHMRHSDINLTMRYYTHLRKGAESETAAKLPDLSVGKARKRDEKAG